MATTNNVETTWSNAQSNKYKVENYCYPEDVTSSQDLQHSIVFFINVRGNSKYKTSSNTLYEVDSNTISKSAINKAALVGGGLGVATGVASTLYGAGKALINAAVTNRIASGGTILGQVFTGAKTGVKTATTAVATTALIGGMNAWVDQSSLYRLNAAITLAVQEPRRVSYKVNYEEWDAGSLIGGANVGEALHTDQAKAAFLNLLKTPAIIGAPNFSNAIQKMGGIGVNPFKTVLFQNVELRKFDFNYKFMPKSAKEAQNVLNIIKLFKFHMHPEFDTSKIFLIHPAEFNIAYYYKGEENSTWHKIANCVLTGMEVDEGADQLSTFQNGQSVEINMKLSFMETEMLTKERIAEGY